MKARTALVLAAFVMAVAMIPTLASAQTPTPTPEVLQPSVILGELADLDFWITLLATLVAGAAGGVVYELLMLQGNIEWPHKPQKDEVTETLPYAIFTHLFDLGIIARVIIGALAAVGALLVLSPPTAIRLLATAVVAGSAGTAVFRSLQDRLAASLALKDVAETKNGVRVLADKVAETVEAYEELKTKVVEASTSPAGSTKLSFEAGSSLNLEDLAKVERLLSETRGMQVRMLA